MRLSSEFRFVFVLLFFCISLPNAKADINDICVNATYQCLVDDVPPNGDVIGLSIGIDYTSTTGEQIDCVTLTLPPGWTYVSGSEVGTNSDADGNYITDTGNGVTFGTAGFCPGGGSGNSSLGAANISIIISVIAPPTWTPGDCNAEGDGDIIAAITWDYVGDGTGEVGATISGVNGEIPTPFDITDGVSCTFEVIPVDATAIIACPQEIVPLGLNTNLELRCTDVFSLLFDDSFGGTGGLAGGFNLTPVPLDYFFDADLNGILSLNGLPPLSGTWCITGTVTSVDIVCATTEQICIAYLDKNAPNCQNLPTCTADFGSFTEDCDFVFPDSNCMLDQLISPGGIAAYEIFYETNGDGSAGLISAVSGYATGQDILNNLNSGVTGEVILFGLPGDCNAIPKAESFTCVPATINVYLVPIEYNAAGNPIAISPTCPVEIISIRFDPSQESLTYIENPGNCDTPATISIGFDLGGGGPGGDEADGDLDDPSDILCNVVESPIPSSFPCGISNTENTPPLTATELANLLGFANPDCYTDVAITAETVCLATPCPPCDAETPTLAIIQTTCPDGSTGAPLSLVASGGTSNAGEITEYIYSDSTGMVSGFTTLAQAQASVEGFAPEDEVCLNVITYVQAELDAIIAQTDFCLSGLLSAFGVPTTGATFQGIYDALSNSIGVQPTINDFETLVLGMNGGPGLGGTSDLDFLLPGAGLTCSDVPPFCYQLNTICITGAEYVTCDTDCKPLDLTINFDDQPQQTTWEITDAGGAVMFSGGPYNNPADNGGTVVESVCLPDGCYDLTFFDAANDGMCPRRISTITSIGSASIGIGGVSNGIPRQGAVMCGNYNLSCPSDGTTFASGGGRFGTSEINNFCLPIVPLIHQDDSVYQLDATDDHTPQMRLLPNVVKDKMTLYYTLQTESDIHIRIMDISGKIVQQHIRNPYDTSELELTVSDLNEGFYFVQLISGDVNMVKKFVKR